MPKVKRPNNIARNDLRQDDVIDANGVASLAVSPNEQDLSSLQTLFDHANWTLHKARSYREGMLEMSRGLVHVIICECQLPDGNWKDVLSKTAPMPERPRLVVISRDADEHLWSEVLALGGYDVLETPLKELEVAYVVGSAWFDWEHEHGRAKRRVLTTVSG